MDTLQESTITSRGQTTLPREIRQALALHPGDKVRYVVLESGEVRIMRTRSVKELKGLLARPGQPAVTLEEMEEGIIAGATDIW